MIYTVGTWIGYAIGFGIIAYILYLLVVGLGHMGKLFTWDLYHHWKYTQNGLCPKCHKPIQFQMVSTDQTYGGAVIRKPLGCTCGAKAIPLGNRRAADWAGF